MKTSALWAFLVALCASSPAFAQKESAVLDFAEHGQIVAVETLRTPGVWEGEIIGGTFAGGWVMRIQTSAGEVMFANSGSSALQSLPLGGDRRIVHFVDELPGCGGGLTPPDHGPEQGGVAGNCDDGTVLDVLVKWTPTAEQQVGGPVAMRALAEAAVAMSNHVYIASGVNVYMRAVGFGITEPYTGDADQYVLNELATNGDGILDSVHAERDALGADLVALITGPSSWYCGIAYIHGANPAAAFSVTVWSCVPGLTFTHEVGHNQGCCHALPECPKAGMFPYSKGHRFHASNGVEYRTVMAYAPGTKVPRLSNPLVPYLGAATGLPLADNARTVRETAASVANYRCGSPMPETRVSSPLLTGPASGATVSFTSTGVVAARPGTQVLIVTRAAGDLANDGETISLRIGPANVGVVIGGSGVDCELESRITSVPAEVFNNAIGDGSSVTFGLRASANVGSCSSSEVSIELRYERATGPTCPADINRDGQISGEDLAFLLSAWGSDGQSEFDSDINDDGIVNGLDLAALLSAWGPSCGGAAPTLVTVEPRSVPTTGGAMITLTGTNLIGTTGVTIGGIAATDIQVVSATSVTAITPAGSAGSKDVALSTTAGTATLAEAVTYVNVTVPTWATPLEAGPDPSVVTSESLRNAIVATGLAWRVRDTATQIEFVLVPPGTYQRGCSPSDLQGCNGNENPRHSVTLTEPFYMGRYEVTQAQWTAVMGAPNPSSAQTASPQVPASQVPNRPVETVSWTTVQTFLSATGVRLPTEAEWEYAYRAGTTTAFHSMPGHPNGTDADTLLGNIAWIGSNSNSQPRPVGQKAANGFGLHDMSGNVSEWVSDWVGPYPSSAVTNPTGPANGTLRVYRGGGYFDSGNCRASHRSSQSPSGAFSDVGFRVARTAISTGSAPTLSAVSPTSGPTTGGTTITVLGTNLDGTTLVTVGGAAATNVQVLDGLSLTAVTPAGSAGARDVTVTTPGGTATLAGAFTYQLAGDECATALTAVIGANPFSTVSMTTSPDPVNASQCPGTSLGWGTANKDVWFRFVPPASGSLSIDTCDVESFNTSLILYSGTSCSNKSQIACNGDVGEPSITVCQGDLWSSIGVAVTGGATYWIRIGGWDGGAGPATGSGTLNLQFTATPTLSAVSPTSGPTTGGTTITLTGTNLTGTTSVTVGGTAATSVQVVNATTVTAVTPAGAAGARDVAVTTPGGTVTLASGFTYVVAPTLTSVTPSSGPGAGGTLITLTGTNLGDILAVTVGGTAATNVQVVNPTTVTAVTPIGNAGAKDVTVFSASGSATLADGFTYIATPTLSAVSPTSGPTTGGTTITLTGTNLTGASSVTVGGTAATSVQVVNATTVTAVTPAATIPAGAGSSFAVDVTVTTPGGTAMRSSGFTYVRPAPTIVSVSPTSGPATGGTTITVLGTNLDGTTLVTVGGAAATNVQVLDGLSLTAVTPAGSSGARDVTVTTPGGTATLAGAFTYQLPGDECATALTAVIGANPFSTVSMTTSPDPVTESQCPGTFLGWGTTNKDVWFRFVPPASGSLSIDTCDVESFNTSLILYSGTSCSNKSQIACNGDVGEPSITVCQGDLWSSIGVAVTGGATYWIRIGGWDGGAGPATGSGTLNLQFSATPTLSAVSPTSGPTTGGTTITLTGTNLTGASSVTVGGTAATSVQVVNATTVTAVTPAATIPAGAGSGFAVDVTVTTPGGTAMRSSGFTYVRPAPAIVSVLPTSGPTTGGTTITVLGTNLDGTTLVTVGGAAATNVQVLDGLSLTAVTPAGSAGARDVTVTTPGGTATLPGSFRFVTVPTWATLLDASPDPSVITSSALRDAIAATGLAWRVRDTATQIEFVLIPPGSYQRGCSPSNGHACNGNESPVHAVTLTQPFYMGRYELTQAQWQARMGSNPSFFQSASTQVPASAVPNRPVEQVSWTMVQGFLSATGTRLPTEAEWEHACRAGTTTAFHGMPGFATGTNDDSQVGNIAWIGSNSAGQTRPVGQKAGNGFGLHDMSGNVWEWVSDWFGSYPVTAQTNPTGPSTGSRRVVRGGTYADNAGFARSSIRYDADPGSVTQAIGFRVARNPQ